MGKASFNLLDQPWIPVKSRQLADNELSLLEAFQRAPTITEIHDPSPLVTVALQRLLLAVVYRAVDGPNSRDEWRQLWREGLPLDRITAYLNRWRPRFDLFDIADPFFQIGGLETLNAKGEPTRPGPVTVLRPEMASKNNKVLFDHSHDDGVEAWSPSMTARALVAAQATALGGGKGPTTNVFGAHPYASHAPLAGGILAYIEGANLAETLLLNLLEINDDGPVPRTGEDRPVWESTTPRPPGPVVPLGYTDYLTLPARAVRLLPELSADGQWQVRKAYVAPGCAVHEDARVLSPMWLKRLDDKRGQTPVPLRPDRAIWRDASALFGLAEPEKQFDPRPAALRRARIPRLAEALGADMRLRIRCVGLANDKANPLAWRSEMLPASVRLLDDDNLIAAVQRANSEAEACASAVRNGFWACASTLLSTADKAPDKKDVQRLVGRMWQHCAFWHELGRAFLDFLDDLAPVNRAERLATWERQLRERSTIAYVRGVRVAQGGLARRLEGVVAGELALRRKLRDALPREIAADQATAQSVEPMGVSDV